MRWTFTGIFSANCQENNNHAKDLANFDIIWPMSDRLLQLLLIDPDPIFRLGLKVTLETIPNLQVIADVPTDTSALKVIAEILAVNSQQIHLIILALDNQQLGTQFCRQLKTLYTYIPILVLTSTSQPELIISAKAIGINGYCPKG
ncbi:response regulator, partial [Dolichospermum circinale CS-545/17]|nr:response regulator [Dolichospermum circinale CS-545/17]